MKSFEALLAGNVRSQEDRATRPTRSRRRSNLGSDHGAFFAKVAAHRIEPVRFYQTGAQGKAMQCKNGDQCSCKSAVRRQDAVEAVCQKLS